MKATVTVINPRRGMYAAEIEGHGEYVIFELLDSFEPEVGDVLSHPEKQRKTKGSALKNKGVSP